MKLTKSLKIFSRIRTRYDNACYEKDLPVYIQQQLERQFNEATLDIDFVKWKKLGNLAAAM